jgi:hypothetical protein
MPDESDHDALNEEFARGQKIGKVGILGVKEGLGIFDDIAFQRALAIDERGDDVPWARFTDFENDEVAVADEGTDHGFAAHFEGEAFRGARNAESVHVHGDASVGVLHHVCCSHACGDLAEDRNVDDFSTVEVFREDDSAGFVRVALDDTFFFQSTQMAHGGGLAGETEVALDVTRGGHDAVGALVAAQVFEEFLLAGCETGVSVGEHDKKGLFVRTFPLMCGTQDVFLRPFQRIVAAMLCSNPLKISALLLLATIGHAQEAAPINPAKMDKTGMLPPYTKVLGERAAAAFGKQDWPAARKAYQEMLELDDGNALIWANLGAVEQQAGDTKQALECFEKSVQINPKLAQTWTALGLMLQKQGDTYRAISCFTRAIHEEPEDARAHNYLAIAAKGLGWTDAAEAELQRAIELKPDYGIAHFNMALMLLERRPPALELARRHYEKALALGVAKDDVVERRLKD